MNDLNLNQAPFFKGGGKSTTKLKCALKELILQQGLEVSVHQDAHHATTPPFGRLG